MNCFIQAFINEGDELVTFEPLFPLYLDHCELSGGKIKTVPLVCTGSDWIFDPEELRKALSSPKVKLFLLNTPHNPTGKVFNAEELLTITKILEEFPDVVVLSDEVYDFLTFDEREHINFATIRENWGKTISIFSGGKLFNATGWKVGWAIAPAPLIYMGGVIANTVFYCFNTPGQVAFANCLDQASEPHPDFGGSSYI